MSRAQRLSATNALFVAAFVAFSVTSSAQPEVGKTAQLARAEFNRGLELAGAGEYSNSIAAFEAAYALKPHHVVLYNIALSYSKLGVKEKAVRYYDLYLEYGGEAIEDKVRLQVQEQLAKLRESSSLEVHAVAPKAPLSPALKQSSELPSVSPTSVPRTALPTAAQVPVLELPLADTTPQSQGISSTVLAFGIPGAVFTAGATGLFLWNEGRHQSWKADDEALQFEKTQGPVTQEWVARQRANNKLNTSLENVQHLWIATGTLGLGLLGFATFLYFDDGDSTAEVDGAMVEGGVWLSVRTTF